MTYGVVLMLRFLFDLLIPRASHVPSERIVRVLLTSEERATAAASFSPHQLGQRVYVKNNKERR